MTDVQSVSQTMQRLDEGDSGQTLLTLVTERVTHSHEL